MAFGDEEDEHHRQQKPNLIKISQSCNASEDPKPFPNLLTEIIFEILSRLPVRSLLRFRSVCKQWCSLISDPHFVKSHLNLSTTNYHSTHHRLIYSVSLTVKTCHPYDMFRDVSINVPEVDYPFKGPDSFGLVVGSCNGLLCISVGGDILCIWNPSTRKSNRLPYNSPKMLLPGWFTMYGFGYQESTDDYKVVEVSYTIKDGAKFETCVGIYSLRNGHWKESGAFCNGYLPSYDSGVFLNGSLHWFATKGCGSSYPSTIVSMDLAKETYGEVFQPLYNEGDKKYTLGVLRDWLCVACSYQGISVDLWAMKVYGVKESWTKLVSIVCENDLKTGHYLVPLWIVNDGKILMQLWTNLYVYDFKSKLFSNIDDCLGACTYVESLVSPYALP